MDRIRAGADPARRRQKTAWRGVLAMAAVFAVVVLGAGGLRMIGHMGGGSTASGGAAAPAAGCAAPAGDAGAGEGADMAARSADLPESAADAPDSAEKHTESGSTNGAAPASAPEAEEPDLNALDSPAGGGTSGAAPATAPEAEEPNADVPAGPASDSTAAGGPEGGGTPLLAVAAAPAADLPALAEPAPQEALEALYQYLGGEAVWQREDLPDGLQLRRTEEPSETALLLRVDGENGIFHFHGADGTDTVWTAIRLEDGSFAFAAEPGDRPCPLCGYGGE